MEPSGKYIDIILRMVVVYAAMFLLFILDVISIAAPFPSGIELPLIVMMVYYWSIYRPTLIPPFLIFCMGLCLDFLNSWPPGLNAFILLFLRYHVTGQRLFLTGQTFVVVWLGYMLAGTVALFLRWSLAGVFRLHWIGVEPFILSVVAGILLFPALSVVLHVLHKILPEIRGQYRAVQPV